MENRGVSVKQGYLSTATGIVSPLYLQNWWGAFSSFWGRLNICILEHLYTGLQKSGYVATMTSWS